MLLLSYSRVSGFVQAAFSVALARMLKNAERAACGWVGVGWGACLKYGTGRESIVQQLHSTHCWLSSSNIGLHILSHNFYRGMRESESQKKSPFQVTAASVTAGAPGWMPHPSPLAFLFFHLPPCADLNIATGSPGPAGDLDSLGETLLLHSRKHAARDPSLGAIVSDSHDTAADGAAAPPGTAAAPPPRSGSLSGKRPGRRGEHPQQDCASGQARRRTKPLLAGKHACCCSCCRCWMVGQCGAGTPPPPTHPSTHPPPPHH